MSLICVHTVRSKVDANRIKARLIKSGAWHNVRITKSRVGKTRFVRYNVWGR